nr:unnamed protein product [Callosobruchus analis]
MLNLPQDIFLPGRQKSILFYIFVADDAFPLSPNIMKPFSKYQERGSMQRIFNYRLSRERRVVENVFGILASQSCVLLHSYLCRNAEFTNKYTPPGSFDIEDVDSGTIKSGLWRNESQPSEAMLPVRHVARKSSQEAQNIKNEDLTSFANILHLDYEDGDKDELIEKYFHKETWRSGKVLIQSERGIKTWKTLKGTINKTVTKSDVNCKSSDDTEKVLEMNEVFDATTAAKLDIDLVTSDLEVKVQNVSDVIDSYINHTNAECRISKDGDPPSLK